MPSMQVRNTEDKEELGAKCPHQQEHRLAHPAILPAPMAPSNSPSSVADPPVQG